MFRVLSRVSVVAIIVLALSLALVAPVSAGSRETQRPQPVLTSHWMALTWSWVQGLVTRITTRNSTASIVVFTPPGSPVIPNTGSCIDPWGHRVPCNPDM